MRTAPLEDIAPLTWSGAVRRYMERLTEIERSEKTILCYQAELDAFGEWYRDEAGEAAELANVRAADLRQWKSSLLAAGLAPATVNKKLSVLKSFLRWSELRGYSTPVEVPQGVRQQKPATRWLTRTEERSLVRALERAGIAQDCALVKVLLHCGLRIEEASTLEWSHLELGERKGWMTIHGKGRKERRIPVDVEARNALHDLAAGSIDRKGHVFVGQRGPLGPCALWRRVVRYGPAAKIPKLSPHALRHTCGKRLIDAGARIEVVAAILGHENLNTTRRYVEPGEADLMAAVERRAGGED
jgi:integrase